MKISPKKKNCEQTTESHLQGADGNKDYYEMYRNIFPIMSKALKIVDATGIFIVFIIMSLDISKYT